MATLGIPDGLNLRTSELLPQVKSIGWKTKTKLQISKKKKQTRQQKIDLNREKERC